MTVSDITLSDLFNTPELIQAIVSRIPNESLRSAEKACKILNIWAIPEKIERLNSGRATLEELGYGTFESAFPFLMANSCHIKRLDLAVYSYTIKDQTLFRIAESFHNLQLLDIRGACQVTDRGLWSIAKGCSSLESLNIRFCNQITDNGLLNIVKGCSSLESLDIGWCNEITNNGFSRAVERCGNLKRFKVRSCANDSWIAGIYKSCRNLLFLDISFSDVTETGFGLLADNCPGLQSLDFRGCKNVTDSVLSLIAEGCSSLKSLDIRCCKKVTNTGIHLLAEKSSSLKLLDIRLCDKITDSGFADVKTLRPNLEVIPKVIQKLVFGKEKSRAVERSQSTPY